MLRQRPIPLHRLSSTLMTSQLEFNPLVHFTFWEHLDLTDIDHMTQCGIWCHTALHRRKADYLPRQYQNIKHSNYVDPLDSIPLGAIQFTNQEIQLVPSLFSMHCSLQSQEYISDPTFPMWEETLLNLVHSVLSQSPFLKCP